MYERISEIIKNDCESQLLDFKIELYPLGKHPKKHEILKDISSMSNHPSNQDKYIIIGVEEKDGVAVGFQSIDYQIDEASFQQYLHDNLEPQISFEYKPFDYKGYSLAYFRVYNNQNRPYLFSKNIKDPKDSKKILYRKGDGYIRVGTSTKKLGREELEQIYEDRYQSRDRKSDLSVTSYIEKSDDDLLSFYDLSYIDISVENLSKKSIAVDIEIKVILEDDLKIHSKFDVRQLIKKDEDKGIRDYQFIPNMPAIVAEINPMHIVVKDYNQYVIIQSARNTGLSLLQQSREYNVFYKDVILLYSKAKVVKGEITIRSDAFTEGALVKSFEIELD